MAGNNKKPRKAKPKTIGALMEKANRQRHQRYKLLNERIALKNGLPLAHPLNQWKLDKTFKPLHVVLDEQDARGSLLVDEQGRPLMWDEDDQDYMLFVPGVVHMCHVFDYVGAALVWGKQPPGLRAFALKLGREEMIAAGDTDDARVTIAWMRERIGKLTPIQWSEHFTAAVQRIDAEDARIAA